MLASDLVRDESRKSVRERHLYQRLIFIFTFITWRVWAVRRNIFIIWPHIYEWGGLSQRPGVVVVFDADRIRGSLAVSASVGVAGT